MTTIILLHELSPHYSHVEKLNSNSMPYCSKLNRVCLYSKTSLSGDPLPNQNSDLVQRVDVVSNGTINCQNCTDTQ